ncbi:L-rhamnose mutarotase [Paenibacillus sp. GCM10027628]|uniref:L-rhamnose mutarotase n=1 Tax=Paenibacillus sp. GCM10027628 TaxID=3273413 RepID=UPI0036424ACA
MNPKVKREIRVARLRRDLIVEYRQLHDHIPQQIVKNLIESGYTDLQIYLHGDYLIMLTEHDQTQMIPDRTIDEQAEEEWHHKTGRCFESFWQQADNIFDMQEQIKK